MKAVPKSSHNRYIHTGCSTKELYYSLLTTIWYYFYLKSVSLAACTLYSLVFTHTFYKIRFWNGYIYWSIHVCIDSKTYKINLFNKRKAHAVHVHVGTPWKLVNLLTVLHPKQIYMYLRMFQFHHGSTMELQSAHHNRVYYVYLKSVSLAACTLCSLVFRHTLD